ncbi:MFS transporter [Corallococcus interemptor]|uniref:MFS transporter n=1 Tax=Corallococcus TaxID=83461 RepID=UPI001CBCD134|nr:MULTISPECIES: MFS transporter [unclassified Corallococcus]MBZ4334376.1 MFS transporter [Corallococcus sp. AS-1-12]MBZ4372765.1 MFS transporter [Corallococcus sp. AS-1-6]
MSIAQRLTITQPMRVFWITWFGQLISILGSGLTSFGVGAKVFLDTRSTTQFALLSFFALAPMVVLSPIAGTLIDRWDRRRAMLLADLGNGFTTLLIFSMLLASERGLFKLETWHFYLPVSLGACFGAFRWPAFFATVTLIVPKQHLGRANAMAEVASGASQILSPIIAGALIDSVGLKGVLTVDVCSFLIAVTTLLMVRFPRPTASEAGQQGKGSLLAEMKQGWSFISARKGLLSLMAFTGVAVLCMDLVVLLITPLVLAFTDISTLGRIASIAGVGALLGGIGMGVWGGPKNPLYGILGFHAFSGVVLFMAAPAPSVPLVAAAAALYLFTMPPVMAGIQSIWQRKIPADLQGRAAAVKRMIILCVSPLASLIAGPLADDLFEPAMREGGALASSMGRLLGVGPGRGIAVIFIVLGLLTLANVAAGWLNPRLRNLDKELPDALPDTPPAPPDDTAAPNAPTAGASAS